MKKKYIVLGILLVASILLSPAIVGERELKSDNCNRIYDVNRDGVINFQDAGKCWNYISDESIHDEHGDLLYDVNMDGKVNFQDCGMIWINRD